MKARYTYWLETDETYLGCLNEYPDHWTQGESLDDLKANLRDLFEIFKGDNVPGIRKVSELEIT